MRQSRSSRSRPSSSLRSLSSRGSLCRLDCWLISDHGDPYLRKTLYNRFHSPSIQTDKRFTVDLNAGGTVQGNHLKEQMHAVVKTVPGPGSVYEPWTFAPKPGLRDVQVRVEATSICGTDMQIYDWHELMAKRVKPPLVMGHEFAGKVVEAGKQVSDLREGDIVSGETHINCGRCFQCRTGNGHVCERMLLRGVDTDGCFAEYHTLHESSAWLNDKRIPVETASAQEPL